jgi:hypothetical protein
MKKLITLFVVIGNLSYAQTTICDTLGISPDKGKDAYVNSWSGYVDTNFENTEEFEAQAWTAIGESFVVRSFIDFEFENIPSNATIINASLYLFHRPGQNHSTLSGSNACYLRRVTSPWEEHTVTWNNQPSTTIINQAEISASTSGTQDFPNIDITDLVVDIHADTINSYGIAITLQTEQEYRQMYFSSGDSPDENKRPFLIVCYTLPVNISEEVKNNDNDCFFYPNPASESISIGLTDNKFVNSTYIIYNIFGQLITEGLIKSDLQTINISALNMGVYYLNVYDQKENKIASEKIIKSNINH